MEKFKQAARKVGQVLFGSARKATEAGAAAALAALATSIVTGGVSKESVVAAAIVGGAAAWRAFKAENVEQKVEDAVVEVF